jgi:hypothetical protein
MGEEGQRGKAEKIKGKQRRQRNKRKGEGSKSGVECTGT